MNTLLAQTRSGPLRYTDPAAITAGVTRGVCRWLNDLGYAALTEFNWATAGVLTWPGYPQMADSS